MIRGIARLAGAAAALLLAAGFLGRWSPPADSLAILRPYAVLGLVLALPWLAPRARWASGGTAALGLATMLPAFVPQAAAEGPVLYSKNLLAGLRDPAPVIADIRSVGADVVLLQEVSEGNDAVLDGLADLYPHRHLCRASDWSGIAVLSRHPFAAPGRCTALRGIAAVPIRWEGQALWFASVHVPWPWPLEFGVRSERGARAFLEGLPRPLVAAGDFNQMPWSARARRMARAAGGRVHAAPRPTFALGGYVPLPIDMVIAPRGAEVRSRPRLGSDHRGLVARIGWDG